MTEQEEMNWVCNICDGNHLEQNCDKKNMGEKQK